MPDKISEFSLLFEVDESKLRELCKTKDIYSAISELLGIDRANVKLMGFGMMYSVNIKEILCSQ